MFHVRLRESRLKTGYTQQEVADMLHMSLNAYQKYEQGTRSPSLDNLVQIANFYQSSIDWMLGRDDYLNSLGVDVDVFR